MSSLKMRLWIRTVETHLRKKKTWEATKVPETKGLTLTMTMYRLDTYWPPTSLTRNNNEVFVPDSMYTYESAVLSIQHSFHFWIKTGIHSTWRKDHLGYLLGGCWCIGKSAASLPLKRYHCLSRHCHRWEPTSLLTWLSLCYHDKRDMILIWHSCQLSEFPY